MEDPHDAGPGPPLSQAENGEGRRNPMVDSPFSQAETCAGDTSAFQPSSHPRPVPTPDFPVKDWDRYEFLRFLGQGGMGMVFLARDRKLGREVAIKFVRLGNEHHLQRFMVEARAQARVDHAHVCKVFEVGEVEGRVFITMQAIVGTSFDQTPGLSLEQKVIALRDAARGVHEAHRVGIIHRDLKPSNIMIERGDDDSLRTFVMDFGLAHEWNQDVTETGSVLGTPAYMSPEQARGEVSRLDRRTDVYSLGATLYHMITGRTPVTGINPLEILNAIGSAEILRMRSISLDVPQDLEAITLKCLESERSRRYDSAKALADDLDRFLMGEPVLARRAGLIYRTHRRFMRHKALAVTGTVATVLVLLALGVALKTRMDAGLRERLAQQFTESMARIEATGRYSALSPLHDIRPDREAVKAHMAQLQADMTQAGSLANGPGHYALGRGYWILDDDEKAREHLQMAWDAGYREPRTAYALALVLGRQYQEKLLEAERIPSAHQRDVSKREIGSRLLDPALTFLRLAKGSDSPSPAYLESLMAFYEGNLDEALERLKKLEKDQPWFYEAPLLRGSLLQARAWKRWNQGEREAAHGDFEAGRAALSAAAVSGRSVPAVYAAQAELELNALIMEKYGQGQVEPAYARGMRAVQGALAAQADHVPSLILQAALLGHLAEFRMDHGQKADDLVEQAVASAAKALEAGPTRADAWSALGQAYYQWGSTRQDQNLDPTEQLAKGLRALESLSPEKRDYAVENHIGLIHQTWSDAETQQGKAPLDHLNGAITAYERATQMEPYLLPAWINLGTCLEQRAVLPKSAHPEEDLRAALKVLDQAVTLNPKHFVPYFVQGKVFCDLALRKRHRGEDPVPDFERSQAASLRGLAINQDIPHLHNGLGFALAWQARWVWETGGNPLPWIAKAKESYRRAISVAPSQVYGYDNLGDLLIWQARISPAAKSPFLLREAEIALLKAQAVSPGNKAPLANLGRLQAVRMEAAIREGGDEGRILAIGEARLAEALRLDPDDRNTLMYLGELRSAAARSRKLVHLAEGKAFDQAAGSLETALRVDPDLQEARLHLVRLYCARAAWERTLGRDSHHSLSLGWTWLEEVLKMRPRWAEAILLQGMLNLEEAEGLPAAHRASKASEALQAFKDALALNQNLGEILNPLADHAKRMSRGSHG
jgi:serine/threonine-protein kinase